MKYHWRVRLKNTPNFMRTLKTRLTKEKIEQLKEYGGNLCLGSEDVGKVLNKSLSFVFSKEKDMEGSEIHVWSTNMLGQFEIKKQVVIGILKSIKVDKSPETDGI